MARRSALVCAPAPAATSKNSPTVEQRRQLIPPPFRPCETEDTITIGLFHICGSPLTAAFACQSAAPAVVPSTRAPSVQAAFAAREQRTIDPQGFRRRPARQDRESSD